MFGITKIIQISQKAPVIFPVFNNYNEWMNYIGLLTLFWYNIIKSINSLYNQDILQSSHFEYNIYIFLLSSQFLICRFSTKKKCNKITVKISAGLLTISGWLHTHIVLATVEEPVGQASKCFVLYWEQSVLHVHILINLHHFTIKWV